MDGQRFDSLTKALVGATPSRRGVVRGLVGGALATVVGGVALKDAAAQTVGVEATSPYCKNEAKFCFKGGGAGERCGNDFNCRCVVDVDKKPWCVNVERFQNSCADRRECDRNRDCGENEVCVLLRDCCSRRRRRGCAPKCS